MTPSTESALRKASSESLGTAGKLFVNCLVFSILAAAVFAALPVVCSFFAFCSGWWKALFQALLG